MERDDQTGRRMTNSHPERVMTLSLQSVESQALQLAPEDRIELANRLLSSVAVHGEIEEAWSVEVERRLVEVEAGRMPLYPLEESLARVRSSIR